MVSKQTSKVAQERESVGERGCYFYPSAGAGLRGFTAGIRSARFGHTDGRSFLARSRISADVQSRSRSSLVCEESVDRTVFPRALVAVHVDRRCVTIIGTDDQFGTDDGRERFPESERQSAAGIFFAETRERRSVEIESSTAHDFGATESETAAACKILKSQR